MNYDTQLQNLTKAIESLADTNIKFLFFSANDLSTPKVRTRFKKFKVEHTPCYIVNGFSTNYWYIYKESVLKYITSPLKPTKHPDIFQTTILSSNVKGSVNHGDHINFSINRIRTSPYSLILSHFTEYIDDGNFNFSRMSRDYNFMLNSVYFTSFDKFVNDTPFTTKTGNLPDLRINKVYNDLHTCKIIYTLCYAALNATSLVGGLKRKTNIKQKGGDEVIYDKVSFDTDEFIDFLKNTLFVRVANIKEGLETIQVIYDEKNELNKNGNENILVVYDFVETYRNIFYVPAKIVLMACFAEREIKNNNVKVVSSSELQCHKQYFDMLKNLETTFPKRVYKI